MNHSDIAIHCLLFWFLLATALSPLSDSQESKQETPSPDETPTSTPLTEEAPVVEVEVKDGEGMAEEEAKDTWEEEEEDTKDAWDASSDEEAEEDSVPIKGKLQYSRLPIHLCCIQ